MGKNQSSVKSLPKIFLLCEYSIPGRRLRRPANDEDDGDANFGPNPVRLFHTLYHKKPAVRAALQLMS